MIRRGKVPLLSECGDKLRLIGGMAVNIRYTLSWCIFGVPGFGDHSSMSPCSQTCRSISDAVEKNILNATASSTYDFCDELSSPADLSPCSSCYSSIKTQLYFSNCKLPHDPFLAFANQFFFPFFPPFRFEPSPFSMRTQDSHSNPLSHHRIANIYKHPF